MGIVSAAIQSLQNKGYEVVAEAEGQAATILAEAPDGSSEHYIGPLTGVSGWVNKRPSFAEPVEPTPEPVEPPMSEEAWDVLYGSMTDADVAAALAPTQEETRALVPVDSEVVKVTGLKAWALQQKEAALEQTRARLAFMRQAHVVESPPVETAPQNMRGKLLDAAYRRKWAFVEFEDRFGNKTTRALMVYFCTPSYALAYCEMRFNELHPAFLTQFQNTWMPEKGYGYAGNKPCRSKQAVKNWATREATRLFKLSGFKAVHILEDRAVPPAVKPEQWVIPMTDEAARDAKRPCYVTNPQKYVDGGQYIQYSDVLALGQKKEE